MAIALRGALNDLTGGSNQDNDVTLTFDTITPPLEDDIVVVFGGHGDAVTTLTAPSGNTSGSYTLIAENTGSAPIFGMWYQRMGATPDTSVTCAGSGNNADSQAYGCYVLSGVTTDANPQDTTATTAGPTTSTNPDGPSITTATANSWVIACAGSNNRDSTPGTISYSNELTQAGSNDTNDITVGAGTFLNVGADAENPAAWSTWASGTWYAITAAFKEDASQAPISRSPALKALALDETLTPTLAYSWVDSPGTKSLTVTGQQATLVKGIRLTGLAPTRVVSGGSGINILRLRREGYA